MPVELTLPPAFYHDPVRWEALQASLRDSWAWLGDLRELDPEGGALPVELFGEPLVLTRDDEQVRALSNVCTHRWNLLVKEPMHGRQLRCGYHGRAFDLAGRCLRAPGFSPVPEAPLPEVSVSRFGPLLFGAMAPAAPLPTAMLEAWFGHLPLHDALAVPGRSRDFTVAAHWALYVDNYLEGLHIPFVHPGLMGEVADYRTELVPGGVMQVAEAPRGAAALSPPPGHPDHGRRIAAWYLWLFPTTMLNVYPWGVSLNRVIPVSPERTRVEFRAWAWDPAGMDQGAGGDLFTVEAEDEAVVEAVARGARASLARRGQLSPTDEVGTAWFHRELARRVGAPAERLERVEERVGWMEHQLHELDGVTRTTADGLARIQKELGDVGSSLRELEHAAGGHEKPPHY